MNDEPKLTFPQSFLSKLRFPQLFVVLSLLFLLDAVWPDPVPFVEEITLAILTIMVGLLRKKSEEPSVPSKEPEKNVTPQA